MRGIIQRRIHLHDVKNRENGIVHYQIAEINQPDGQSESIRIGDNGLFFGRGTGNPPLYIGMILDIFTKGEPNKPYFLVRWFYRASEIPIMEDYAYDPYTVYLSDVNDEVPIDAFFERVDVFFHLEKRKTLSATVPYDSLTNAVQKGYEVHKFDHNVSFRDPIDEIVALRNNPSGGQYEQSSSSSSISSLPWPLTNSFYSYTPYSLPLPFVVCCGIYRPWQKRIDDLDEQFNERYHTFTLPSIEYFTKGQYLPAHFRNRKIKVFLNIRGGNVSIKDPNFIDTDISMVKPSFPVIPSSSSSPSSRTVPVQGKSVYLDSSGGIISSSSSSILSGGSVLHTGGSSNLISTIIIPPKAKSTETKMSSVIHTGTTSSSSSTNSNAVTVSNSVTNLPSTTAKPESSDDSTAINEDSGEESKEETHTSFPTTRAEGGIVVSHTAVKQKPRGRGRPPISYYGAIRQAINADSNNMVNGTGTSSAAMTSSNTGSTVALSGGTSRSHHASHSSSGPIRLPLRYDIMDTIGWNKVRPLGGDPCIRLVNNKKLQTCRPGALYQVYLPPTPIAPLPPYSPWQQEQQSINASIPWVPPVLPLEPSDNDNEPREEKVPYEWPDNATTSEDETEVESSGTSTNDENNAADEKKDSNTTTTTTPAAATTTTLSASVTEVTKEEGAESSSAVAAVPVVETAITGTTIDSTTTVTITENVPTDTVKPETKKKVPKGRTLFDLSNVQDPPPVPWTLERAEKEPMKLQWSTDITLRNNTLPSSDKSRTLTLSLDDYLFVIRKESIALRTGIRVGAPHPRFIRTWPGVLVCWTEDTTETSLSALEASLSSVGNGNVSSSSSSSSSPNSLSADTVAAPGYAYVSFIDSKYPVCVPLRSLEYGSLHRWLTDEESLEILHQKEGDVSKALEFVRQLIQTRKTEAAEYHRTHYENRSTGTDTMSDTGSEAPKPVHAVTLQLSHHESGQNLRQGIETLKGTCELSCLPRISSETGLISSIHCEEYGYHVGGPGRGGWSPTEQLAFASGITRFGKNFHHIAGIIPDKTVGQCVAYYFRNKHFRMLLQGIGYRSLNPTPRAGLKSSEILRDSTTLYIRPRSTDTITGEPSGDKDKIGNNAVEESSIDGQIISSSNGNNSDRIHIGPPRLPLLGSTGWPGGPNRNSNKFRNLFRGRSRGRPPLRSRRVNRYSLQSNTEDDQDMDDAEAEDDDYEENDDDEEEEEEEMEEEETVPEELENDDDDNNTEEITNSAIPPPLTSLVGGSLIDRNSTTPVTEITNGGEDTVAASALLEAIIDESTVDDNPLTATNAEENDIMQTLENHTIKESLDDIDNIETTKDEMTEDLDDHDQAKNDDDDEGMDQETSGDDNKDTGAEDETNDNDDSVTKPTEVIMSQQPRRSGRGTLQVGDLVILPRELTYPDTQVHAVLKTLTSSVTTTLSTLSTDPGSKFRKAYLSISPVGAASIVNRWCSLCRRMQASVLVCTNPDCAATVCDRCFRSSIQQRRFNPFGMPAKPSWRLARNNSWWMCCDCCPPIPTPLEWELYSRWSKSLLALHALHAPIVPHDPDGENSRSAAGNRTAPNPTDRTLRQRSGISFSELQKNAYKPDSLGEEGGRTKRSRLARDGIELEEGIKKDGSKRAKKGQDAINTVDYAPAPFTYSKFDMTGGSVSKTVTLQDAFSYLGRIKEFFGPSRESGVSAFMRLLSLYKKRALTVIALMRDIIHLLTSYRAPKPLLRDFSFFVPAEHHAFYYESCMTAFRNAPVPLMDAGILPREGRKMYNRPIIPMNGVLYLRGRQGYIHQLDYISPSLDLDVHQYKVSNNIAPPPPILPPSLQHLQGTAIPFYPPLQQNNQPPPQPQQVQQPPQSQPQQQQQQQSMQQHPQHPPQVRPPHMGGGSFPMAMGQPNQAMHPMGHPPSFAPPSAGYPHPHHPYGGGFPPNHHPSQGIPQHHHHPHHPGMPFMSTPMARNVMNAPPRPMHPNMGGNIIRPMNVPSIGSHNQQQGPQGPWNPNPPGQHHQQSQHNVRPPSFPTGGGPPNQMMMVMMNAQQQLQHQQQQVRPPSMLMNTAGGTMMRPPPPPGYTMPPPPMGQQQQQQPMGGFPPHGHHHPGQPMFHPTMMMGRPPTVYVNNAMGGQQPQHPSLMGHNPPRG